MSEQSNSTQEQQEINRAQLTKGVREAMQLTDNYFSTLEEMKKRHDVNNPRVRGEKSLIENDDPIGWIILKDVKPEAVIRKNEGSENVYAKVVKEWNGWMVVLSPADEQGRAIPLQRERCFSFDPSYPDIVYEINKDTNQVEKHDIQHYDEGDTVYTEVAEAFLACAANIDPQQILEANQQDIDFNQRHRSILKG